VLYLLTLDLLGYKGASLCEMVRIGVRVPPGFIISTECCLDFLSAAAGAKSPRINDQIKADYKAAVANIETSSKKKFGGKFPVKTDTPLPLLLSVRSGAPISMPGTLGTVLNVGINDQIAESMAHISLNPRWAYDTYRRFLQMFGTVVLGLDERPFLEVLSSVRQKRNVQFDGDLLEDELREVVCRFKLIASVPDDPWQQLDMAVQAVFRSWNSPRAVKYRDVNRLSSEHGTAVTVQSMVYGNLNAQSGSGVAFTRNPTTGDKALYGEYLPESEVSPYLGRPALKLV
jgi:pyruvate,orthophosphate dikinase